MNEPTNRPLRRSKRSFHDDHESARQKQAKESMPSRRERFPSNKHKLAKWFYNTLIILFICLAVGLFVFGRQLLQH